MHHNIVDFIKSFKKSAILFFVFGYLFFYTPIYGKSSITALANGSTSTVPFPGAIKSDARASNFLGTAREGEPPGAPTITSAEPGVNSAFIHFTPPASDGGEIITNYEYSLDGGMNWITRLPESTVSPLEIIGLTGCSEYSITLRAVNNLGSGASSTAATVTPRTGQGAGITWTSQTVPDRSYTGVTYGNGLFVAVNKWDNLITSPDGITWTSQTTPFGDWQSVVWGNGLFVAVGFNGAVMTSTNGTTWTSRTAAASNKWTSVTYGNGLFVAVSKDGTDNRVMTSTNGITWTSQTSAADYTWLSVTYASGLFVAVAEFAGTNGVMTSTNGINWTLQNTPAASSGYQWKSVTYGNGLFVAVSSNGQQSWQVMTSPDGITWTSRAAAAQEGWVAITFGNGLFAAVSVTGSGNRVMTSPDGITWTSRASTADITWNCITYANQKFVALAGFGTGPRIMTSENLLTPDKPIINYITPGIQNLSVNFTAPSDPGGSAITNYEYSVNNGSSWSTRTPSITTSPINITGLTPSTEYQVELRAVNAQGTGCPSDMTTVLTIMENAPDGSNDPSFNAVDSCPADASKGFTGTAGIVVQTLAVQADSKIIAGGNFTSVNGVARNCIVRLEEDGTVDNTFDPGSGFNANVMKVAIQSDGKYLVSGSFTEFSGISRKGIARLNTDGTLDTTFDPGTGFSPVGYQIQDIIVQSDNKIILSGSFTSYNGTNVQSILRLNSDGSLDNSFSTTATFNASTQVNTISLQSDGKVIAGGTFQTFGGVSRYRIVRLNSDRTNDGTFSIGTGFNNNVWSSAIQTDGKIVVGGNFTGFNGVARNAIARLNSDGSLDTDFDPGTGFSGGIGRVVSITIQPDGKILVGGLFTTFNGTTVNRIARLNSDGSLDTSFDMGTGFDDNVYTIAVQSDTKLLVGGQFTSYNGACRTRLARLNYSVEYPTNLDFTTLQPFNYCPGIPSDVQTFSLSGTELAATVTITAPTGFEIRKTGDVNFASMITLPIELDGSLVTTSVDIRVKASATVTMTADVSITSGTDTVSLTVSATAAPPKNINIQGNNLNIFAGDDTPDTLDDTQFGVVTINKPATKTYTIQNTGTGDLVVSAITLAGANPGSFVIGGISLPATIAQGSSTTFTVTITANSSGLKIATVVITSNDECSITGPN